MFAIWCLNIMQPWIIHEWKVHFNLVKCYQVLSLHYFSYRLKEQGEMKILTLENDEHNLHEMYNNDFQGSKVIFMVVWLQEDQMKIKWRNVVGRTTTFSFSNEGTEQIYGVSSVMTTGKTRKCFSRGRKFTCIKQISQNGARQVAWWNRKDRGTEIATDTASNAKIKNILVQGLIQS